MDRNYLIDLAISILQDCANEWHIKEELSGLETELDGMDQDEMPELFAKTQDDIDDCKARYIEIVKLRRAKMDYLGQKSPAYDYHKRCQLKHAATAYVTMSEAYLANTNETAYTLLKRSEDAFYSALKMFMGVDNIPNCGRCLSDELNRMR